MNEEKTTHIKMEEMDDGILWWGEIAMQPTL